MMKEAQKHLGTVFLIGSLVGGSMVALPLFAKTTPSSTPLSEKDRLEAKRMEVRQALEERQQQLKNQLAPEKQQLVSRVTDKMNALNGRLTHSYDTFLTRLSSILDKIEKREAILVTQKKDVTALKSAVSVAREAIAAARQNVDAAQQVTYALDLLTVESVGQPLRDLVQQFMSNQQEIRQQSLVPAREAVKKAFDQLLLLAPVTSSSPTP